MSRYIHGIAVFVAAYWSASAAAGDWPMYRADGKRSGAASAPLAFPLQARWHWRSPQPPRPAWPQPGRELHRMDFDYAFQPVVADGRVFFASSADDALRSVDLATGELLWRFVADAPLRFAPCVADGKVYIAGDDGVVRCLNDGDGREVWSFRAAPADDMLLGNGRMISRWPLRNGVLVLDRVAYVTAGMWPSQGVYVYALDAETGKVVWCNDNSGCMYMRFPHPVASGFGDVAPQGYLLASDRFLLAPTGRSIPAVFDRSTGELLYYKSAEALRDGGSWAMVWRGLLLTPTNRSASVSEASIGEALPHSADGMVAYSLATGEERFRLRAKYRVLAVRDTLFTVGGEKVEAIDASQWKSDSGKAPALVKWSQPYTSRAYCLILAGRALVVGGQDVVNAYDADTGKPIWQAAVDGQVRGLAAAERSLLASTDKGAVICFSAGAPAATAAPVAAVDATSRSIDRARAVLEAAGTREGYALVLGEKDAGLALGLARESGLHVIAALPRGTNAQHQRHELLRTGLYGTRVTACALRSPDRLPFASYFGDLVVVTGSGDAVSASEACRVLRPCGGKLLCPDMTPEAVAEFAMSAGFPEMQVRPKERLIVRGKLPGAGEWRYPWADAGRSGVSDEQRVRLPLDVLWFGGPGPDRMMDRHLATAPPLCANGRAFVTGQDHVIAFDAYTGRELWSRRIQGVGRRYTRYYASNFVADHDSVYVALRGRCSRLGQAAGDVVSVFDIPEDLLGKPAAPETRDVAQAEPWRHGGNAYRAFLACADAPQARPPWIAQGCLDPSAVPSMLDEGSRVAPASVHVTRGGRNLPAEVTPLPDGGCAVRTEVRELPTPEKPICVYFDTAPSSTAVAKSTDRRMWPALDGLIAAYDFENAAETTRDVSGNGHHGRADSVAHVDGHSGQGAAFDGRTSYVLVKPDKGFNVTQGLTVQAWVKLDRYAAGTILYKAYQYGLYAKKVDGKYRFSGVTRSGEFVSVESKTAIELGKWYHVAMTHDGRIQRLYVDGKLEAKAEQGKLTTSSNHLCIGASCYAPPKVYSHLPCSTDDIRIYARPMGRAEIRRSMKRRIPATVAAKLTWIQKRGDAPRPIRDWRERGWGYLSVADEIVLGSYTAPVRDPESPWAPQAESSALFALNKSDGAVRWSYRAGRSMSNNEIAHSDGTLFLLDATSNSEISKARRRGAEVKVEQALVALRLSDGVELWRQPDVLVPGHRTYTPKDVPVYFYLFIAHRSQLQVSQGVVVVDGIAAYDAETGRKLWQRKGSLRKLSLIHGSRLIVPPYGFDLRTGKQCMTPDIVTGADGAWRFIKAYGCGATVGCQNLLCFRSGSFGFLDIVANGTTTFAGGKPNCNVSMAPAGGLVIMAEGSSGCSCSYNFQTSLALAPAERPRDVWYTFPAVAPWGEVKHLRVNFGAPGDRRDTQANAWLGFPRPQLSGVCPAPVAVRMSDATYFYEPRKHVEGTHASPSWLHHCGLRGVGAISVDLVTHPGVSVFETDAAPVIDGDASESCWQRAQPVAFEDTGRFAFAPNVELKLLRDATHLYVSCTRRYANTQAAARGSEAFHIFLTDRKRRNAARFGMDASGTTFQEGGKLPRRGNLDATWRGDWTAKLLKTAAGWCAESAIPLATLDSVALHKDALYVNCMARLSTRHGLQEIYLTDPIFIFAHCCRFLPMADPPARPDERSFTVRLHFGATDRAAPGARVFDVTVQGRKVIAGLDIAKESGGKAIAIVKEVRGVRARGRITIGLQPKGPGLQPVINAIEVLRND